jgi:hypothetical protein
MAARKKKKSHSGAFMSKLQNVGKADEAGQEGDGDDSKQSKQSQQSEQSSDEDSLQSKPGKQSKPSEGAAGSRTSESGAAPGGNTPPSARSRGEGRDAPSRRTGAGVRKRRKRGRAKQPSPLAVRTEPHVKDDFKDLAVQVQALSTLEFGEKPTQGVVMEAIITMVKEEVDQDGISHRLFDYLEQWAVE